MHKLQLIATTLLLQGLPSCTQPTAQSVHIQLGQHSAQWPPSTALACCCRHCAVVHINQQPILCTASWDKTLRYWDMRQPQPMHQQGMQERVYAMDVKNNLLVAGLANRHIQVRHRAAQGWAVQGRVGSVRGERSRLAWCWLE